MGTTPLVFFLRVCFFFQLIQVSQIDSSLHRCNVFVPAGVAALLQSYPTLVAPAIHAFCQRDASQLQVFKKCLVKMSAQTRAPEGKV
jgi:hypothetical protein